ncbi:hypothetical protein LXL04_013579 [Taraxacum kok-saghyz]
MPFYFLAQLNCGLNPEIVLTNSHKNNGLALRRCGSLPRSLISTARSSTIRRPTTTSLPHLRPPPQPSLHGHRLRPGPTPSLPGFGTIGGVLGCTQSLLPLHSVVAAARLTSHVAVDARACCELSQGT